MKIIKGNLFNPTPEVNAICIPTNGIVKANGRAVMGAGVAKIARDKWPDIDLIFGDKLTKSGHNSVYRLLQYKGVWILSFPTKEDWKNPSTLARIEHSARQLDWLTKSQRWQHVWLPVVGCGLGGLSWTNEVAPLLSSILDDRFTIIMRT